MDSHLESRGLGKNHDSGGGGGDRHLESQDVASRTMAGLWGRARCENEDPTYRPHGQKRALASISCPHLQHFSGSPEP